MAEIVNLRGKRKAVERDARRRKGDENAAKFGRTRAERDLERARADKARDHLDTHLREPTCGRPQGPGDAAQGSVDAVQESGAGPKAIGEAPRGSGTGPQASGDSPQGSGTEPRAPGDAALGSRTRPQRIASDRVPETPEG